jgi:hypothetical protein
MTLSTSVEIFGVRDALAELREISPKARAGAVRGVKQDLEGLLKPARAQYPQSVKLKGWSRGGRLGYEGTAVRSGVQIVVGGRKPRRAAAFPIVTVVQKNAGGALFSLAGMQNGSQSVRGKNDKLGRPYTAEQSIGFLNKLAAEHGKAQRGLWKARKEIQDSAGESISEALEKVVKQVNRKLVPQTPEAQSALRGYRFDITRPDTPGEWY